MSKEIIGERDSFLTSKGKVVNVVAGLRKQAKGKIYIYTAEGFKTAKSYEIASQDPGYSNPDMPGYSTTEETYFLCNSIDELSNVMISCVEKKIQKIDEYKLKNYELQRSFFVRILT